MDGYKKVCTKCNETLDATIENFRKMTRGKFGLGSVCRKCISIQDKEYRESNKEKSKLRTKTWYESNKERHATLVKNWREANKEYVSRRRIEEHLKNREKDSLKGKEWRKNNKGKLTIKSQKRRNSAKLIFSNLTKKQWDFVLQKFNHECAYCGMGELDHMDRYGMALHQEHVIALSKGGEYTVRNLVPSCIKCNSSKLNKNFGFWFRRQLFYSELRELKIIKHLKEMNKTYDTINYEQISIFNEMEIKNGN